MSEVKKPWLMPYETADACCEAQTSGHCRNGSRDLMREARLMLLFICGGHCICVLLDGFFARACFVCCANPFVGGLTHHGEENMDSSKSRNVREDHKCHECCNDHICMFQKYKDDSSDAVNDCASVHRAEFTAFNGARCRRVCCHKSCTRSEHKECHVSSTHISEAECCRQKECHKVSVVVPPNAVADPVACGKPRKSPVSHDFRCSDVVREQTVVVISFDTIVALSAVHAAWWSPNVARRAVFEFQRFTSTHNVPCRAFICVFPLSCDKNGLA